MFVMQRKVALVKCSLSLFSHLTSCHHNISSTALWLRWVLVPESREPGGRALAVQSQRASQHFIPNQTLPHAGLRGGSKCLTPVPGAGCLLQTQVYGVNLFKEEIWNQAITLEEVPSPKLTHFVTLLTSHKKGRNFGTLELTLELFSFKFPVVCF